MNYEKLEIYLLAQNGAVERRIRCFAGRVSVLRETAQGELDKYAAALGGEAQAERFSILVDEKGYLPGEHFLIGFSNVLGDESRSVAQYLAAAGAPATDIERLLLQTGLGGSANRQCASLNEIESRSVLLLAATYADDGRVVVLNDPFKYFSPAWVEFHAERICDFALRSKAIVVVVNLSVRPECWIENELIARIQVGGVRRRTIGFGSTSPEMNELLAQVRADSGQIDQSELSLSKESSDITTYKPLKPFHSLTATSAKASTRTRLFGDSAIPVYILSGTVAAGITLLLLWDSALINPASNSLQPTHLISSQNRPEEILVAKGENPAIAGSVNKQPSSQPKKESTLSGAKQDSDLAKVSRTAESNLAQQDTMAAAAILAANKEAAPAAWPLLKGYPAQLQQQIMIAYNQTPPRVRAGAMAPSAQSKQIANSSKPTAQPSEHGDHVAIFSELSQVTKDTKEATNKPNPFLTNPANNEQAAEFARRREEILKRFLEERD